MLPNDFHPSLYEGQSVETFLSIRQAAEILGISTETLRRWDNSGKFPSSRHPINNYRIYTLEQVKALKRKIDIVPYENENLPKIENLPYFKTPLGKLYQMDAINFLKNIEGGTVDLIFADPPYNIRKAEWDTFESQKKYVKWCLEWIEEGHRTLTSKGTMYICGFSEILADIKWAASYLFRGCKWLVWYYRNKANLSFLSG